MPAVTASPRFALRLSILLTACLSLACLLPTGQPAHAADAPTDGVPAFGHVFVVVLENKELDRIHRRADAPYLNQLAASYGLATRYYGVSHPSLPNYLAMISGDTFGVESDCEDCTQSAPTLADQVEASGRSWKGYFESMPRPCYVGSTRDGLYAQKHNPFIYFDGIRKDPARCERIVPFDHFADDLARGDLPNLVWLGPNMRSSTHDASVAEGDDWLAAHLPPILASPAFQQDGLLVVTYDEGDTDDGCCGQRHGGGNIMTVVASPLGKRGFVSATPYNHYSLLRTIEDAWGLEHLGHAADPAVKGLSDFFSPPASP